MRLYIFQTEDEIGDKDIEAETFEEAYTMYFVTRGFRPGVPVTVINDRGKVKTLNA